MKRAFKSLVALALLLGFILPIQAEAVSANPSPVCSGATCTVTFTYTGDYYQWNAPLAATYVLETWGAQGGNAGYNGTVLGYGGKGGYAKGSISLTIAQTLYIYVGGQADGTSGTATATSIAGGYNGGGNGYQGNSSTERGAGGGGGTDIRTGGNALGNRIIVSGGGAGGVKTNSGYGVNYPGVGGGLLGGDGYTDAYGAASSYHGKGGTASAGGAGGTNGSTGAAGSLGVGGGTTYHTVGYGIAGGGGGYWGGGGGGTGMGAGGGSGYVGTLSATTLSSGATLMPDPNGGTMTGNSGNGVARITYPNGPRVTTFDPRLAITNSTDITYDLTFSESVSGLIAGDFTKSGTGSGTCSIGAPSGSATTYVITVTGCSVGTVVLSLAANSVSNAGAQTGPSLIAAAATVTIDQTAPTISGVTAPANATYKPSDTPTFMVNFSESVTVTGSPRLVLAVGSATEYAVFQSLSDSKTALFRYTVATDPVEFDTDGIAVSTSLSLNGGSIQDLATNALTNLSFSAPTLTSVLVAQPAAAPTIDSITATSGQLAIYFTPGAARGSTTTTYQYSSNGGAFTNRPTGTTASPLILTGLTNGTGYTIRLRATTNAGAGDSSTAVTETPTSITVTGDATLVLTYGNSASTSAYSASGGTNTFTWSLGSSLTGISLSGTTVTASSSTPSGTYSQTVRATDGNSQVGSKSLTITVNKASTSITIALPNSATNAALGGAVTITATVPRAGAVNFMLGGTTISGCGSSTAVSTSATCSWTPGALGSVSLTATFTPTDSANFETSTTTTLSITVVNGVSTVTLSLTGGTTTPPKGQAINIIAAVDQAGRITFMIDGKRIPGCNNKVANVGNVTCSWKPAIQKETTITARLVPTNNVYNASNANLRVQVVRRSGLR